MTSRATDALRILVTLLLGLCLLWAPSAHASPYTLPRPDADPVPDRVPISLGVPTLTEPAPTERTKGSAADAAVEGTVNVRRIGLVVGANDGGPEREVLRYATSDAKAIARVLRDLGGVGSNDMIQLADPNPQELREAFQRVRGRLASKAKGEKVQFIFYYSGHSDETGLLLGGSQMNYRALRKEIDKVPADVRIAILDSCASGAFTRLKGGTKRAPFLVSAAQDVEGHAFLTSSSADEAAQESDRIGGSFFTHFLGTGLRGAADANKDNLITLSEAYQFAFDETLARTEATRGGAQHAAYEIQLSGTGDLVMTDLRRTTARLELTSEIGGRIYVRNPQGDLAAELYKPVGSAPVLLSLEPGRYTVMVDDDRQLWRAQVKVSDGRRTVLTPANLQRVKREQTTERGDGDEGDGYKNVPVNVGLFPPLSLNGATKHPRIRNTFSVSLLWSKAARVDGAALSMGFNFIDEELDGISWGLVGGNINRGSVRGAQVGALFNSTKHLRGVQLGGVNVVGAVDGGSQAGLINVGRQLRRGVQVGLINYANSADAQVGLISATKEGGVHPELWTSDTALVNVGLRLPSKYTYTLLVAGLSPVPREGQAMMLGLGFGGQVPLPYKLSLNIDGLSWVVGTGLNLRGPIGVLTQLRLMLAWQPFKHFGIFGGPTLNAMIDNIDGTGRDTPRPGYPWTSYTFGGTVDGPGQIDTDDPTRVRIWPGFAAGFRF
jgi:hypothetical protein